MPAPSSGPPLVRGGPEVMDAGAHWNPSAVARMPPPRIR